MISFPSDQYWHTKSLTQVSITNIGHHKATRMLVFIQKRASVQKAGRSECCTAQGHCQVLRYSGQSEVGTMINSS